MYETILYMLEICGLLSGAMLLWRISFCTAESESGFTHSSVSIIIPARNEAETLPHLLSSIQSQNDIKAEIIVVDDHSTDNTASAAASCGADVLTSAPLPRGWVGKTWACHQGAEYANSDIFLFLDADTVIQPGGLQRILGTISSESGVVSIAPFHVTRKMHEQFSAIFNLIVIASVNAFSIFSSPRTPGGLFGPCLVIRRTDYYRIGGHKSVKGKILENLYMAEKCKENNVSMACYGGKGVISYRMYPDSIRQVVNGWSKVFASGASHTKRHINVLISLWFAGLITAPAAVVIAMLIHDTALLAGSIVLYICFALEQYRMLRKIGHFYIYTPVLFPCTVLFFLIVFTYSMVQSVLGTGVDWKGRTVPA